ncbi:MAG: hypothetical protein CM1200mP18_15040 [Gammaproteobacteria bacterium]|nr:MAG: hypothetical protein CM1200mP18_15040 [Gammaproteobacteria bacterium]
MYEDRHLWIISQIPIALWIAGVLALYMAWAIGANDVANAMGPVSDQVPLRSGEQSRRLQFLNLRGHSSRVACDRYGTQRYVGYIFDRP